MRIGRLVLVVATLVTILVFPVLIRDALQALRLPSAYAAAGPTDAAGRVYQNGNVNDNDGGNNDDDDDDDDDDNENKDDDESDNEGEDNDNEDDVCYQSLNSNEEVPCDYDDNGNNNDNAYYPPAPAPSAPISYDVAASRRCFSVQEPGDVQLTVEGGTVVVRVVTTGSFAQTTWIELDDVADLGTVPAPPGGAYFLGKLVWHMNAGNGCDGPGMGMLPGAVNLGVPYNAPADKSKLQVVMLKNNAWVEVPTVPDPDPNNPYISATVQETGIYAVIHKP